MACDKKCITLQDNTQQLSVKHKDGGNISMLDTTHHLCIEKTKIDFKVEIGYVSGNNSYAPLSDKPAINYRILQSGNNTYDYLGVQEKINDITEQDIDNIIYGG